MKRSWAMKWARDLETTRARQTQLKLNDGEGGFCCLGRLCVLAKARGKRSATGKIYYHGEGTILPSEVMEMVGMRTQSGVVGDDEDELSSMNDGGMSFAEIAKVIRKRWKEL